MGDTLSSLVDSGPPAGHLRVHVRLSEGERHPTGSDGGGDDKFGLHVWGSAASAPTPWDAPVAQSGEDWFGPYFDVPLVQPPPDGVADPDGSTNGAASGDAGDSAGGGGGPAFGAMLHRGEDKRASVELATAAEVHRALPELWFGHGGPPTSEAPTAEQVPAGDLAACGARAHWLRAGHIAWRAAAACPRGGKVMLYSSAAGALRDGGSTGVRDADTDAGGGPFELEVVEGGLPEDLVALQPYLAGCGLLSVPATANARVLCRRQLAVAIYGPGPDGRCLDCTGVQIGPLLDELFAFDGPLGCFPTSASPESPTAAQTPPRPRYGSAFRRCRTALGVEANGVTLALWAPSAREVSAVVYSSPRGGGAGEPIECEWGNDGVWRVHGPATWWDKYYTYRVKAYHPLTGKVETMETPDPYSHACSADAGRTLACYLPTWADVVPGGNFAAWRSAPRPAFKDRGNAVVYELHVRDFSVSDQSVPAANRGKYSAFQLEGTVGDTHLRRLAAAGITHVQVLPSYDFGTVPERLENQRQQQIPQGEPPDSMLPQKAAMEVADVDGFNWGYDPVLYDVPEGSYASNPDGAPRILEHRQMVHALHAKGLRVVLDVVYNHTLASGPAGPQSVLDKCVPGYYHRRSESGAYEQSTCMNNTAAERTMMERLVVDSLMHWTKEYRVDGFRFDLMGHLPLRCLQRCRAALDALTEKSDGVDGKNVLLYGEGWEFGEVAGDKRRKMAVQRHLAGTGLGSFNDRVRDAALGGTPFVDPRTQGLTTGLFFRPWPEDAGVEQGDAEKQRREILVAADKVRLALVGSLKRYVLEEDCDGNTGVIAGDAHGGGVAYTAHPEEIVNYVSAHDNETLFDNTAWKMSPSLFSADERMRANWLNSAIIALSHGVPFFHAGDEVLRSKSLDRDSYNSGDWFNVLDFTGARSGFGVGLPPENKNGDKWPLMRTLLTDPSVKPTQKMVAATTDKFCELLKVRASTPLLGITDEHDIFTKVGFPGCGAQQEPGIIVMQVRNGPRCRAPHDPLCPNLARLVVVISTRLEEARVPTPAAPDGVQAEAPGSPTAGTGGSPSRPRWGSARRSRGLEELKLTLGEQVPLRLHPLQAASKDPATRTARVEGSELVVPAQSACVFVEPLPGREAWTGSTDSSAR